MNEFLYLKQGTIFLQREVLSSEPTIIFFEDMLVFRGVFLLGKETSNVFCFFFEG